MIKLQFEGDKRDGIMQAMGTGSLNAALVETRKYIMGPRYRGTPPKRSTCKRVLRQVLAGWPHEARRVEVGGKLYHPTKGLRTS